MDSIYTWTDLPEPMAFQGMFKYSLCLKNDLNDEQMIKPLNCSDIQIFDTFRNMQKVSMTFLFLSFNVQYSLSRTTPSLQQ